MSKNVDLVAVVFLLMAAALVGGLRNMVSAGLHNSGHFFRIERNGSQILVRPVPAMPPMPRIPKVQLD